MEATDDGASTDVAVVTLIVGVLLKRHLQEQRSKALQRDEDHR